jgi:hypothetical protein
VDVDVVTELQALLARLSPARRASLLDYARYLASCEEQNQPMAFFDRSAPVEPPGDDVLDDCRRRGYGGLLGREP